MNATQLKQQQVILDALVARCTDAASENRGVVLNRDELPVVLPAMEAARSALGRERAIAPAFSLAKFLHKNGVRRGVEAITKNRKGAKK